MAKDPAFLFYPGDYLRDTQCLSPAAQVAYDRIMCEHMRNICISHAQLKFFTKRLTDDEREEVMAVLKEADGCFQIEWVAESICKRKDYSESRRKNRTSKPKNDVSHISSTYDNHMENENEIVNEDEVVTETGIARIEKNQTAIAPRNVPHETIHAYFSEIGFPNEAAKFIDYYAANGWKVGKARNPMKDWKASVRNWCRRAQPDAGKQMLNRKQTMNDAREIFNEAAALIDANRNQNP
jgi:hypothetical protein